MLDTTKKGFGTETKKVTKCRICGSDVMQNSTGRFKDYCSDDCRDFNKFKSAFIDRLDKVDFKDYSYVKAIKSELFCLVNSMPKDVK